MREWLTLKGVGETRAILVEDGRIIAARVEWPGTLSAGTVVAGKLISKRSGSSRGTAVLADGTEVLVDRLPNSVTEGETLDLIVTRPAMTEKDRTKLAQARLSELHGPDDCANPFARSLARDGFPVSNVHPLVGFPPECDWDEIVEAAIAGSVTFPGGSLTLIPTAAMTLIDVDGDLPPLQLALAAIPAIADALRRLDICGSVGIDFPTLAERKDRQAVDQALAEALRDWRGERTAMNGFGFVQLVSKLERPSILSLYQHFPARIGAITAARRALAVPETGGKVLIVANPLVKAEISQSLENEIERLTGRKIEWKWDEGIAFTACFAQSL